ncbi:peptidoglycan/LPS O-acetylase OafA/YrhL [Bradyrhizobium japonicum]|uniref:acyltransferase family protein n=1 Tax=Bradyrhizobium japonicum TaxID=375 RepID=UPI00339172EB
MGVIRFALALSVVFWHIRGAPFHLMNAAVAVTLFFIISGFYMAMVINEKYASDEPEHWIRMFYIARFWRLYPPYLVMLIVMLFWSWPTNAPSPFFSRLPMSALDQAALIFSNLFLFGQDVHQFLVRVRVENAGPQFLLNFVHRANLILLQDNMMAIGHAWSLAAEAMFYLVAPFFVRSVRRTMILLAAALAFRFSLLEILGQRSGIWGYYFFPGAVCMFLMGSVAYHLRKMIPRTDLHATVGRAALAGFAVWFVSLSIINGVLMESPADWSIDQPKFWVLYITFAASIPFIFEATKRSLLDREIGELSYPLYLVHGLVVGLVYYRWTGPQGVVPDAWAAVAFSIIAAYAMRQLVEIPIEKWRNNIASLRATPSAQLKTSPAAP